MSDSVRPHRQQPPRVPHPWDSPGKNTEVGCHFPLQCVKVKSESEVSQSCPTLGNPMDYIQSMEFSRPEYWSVGTLSLLQGIFPIQGLNPGLDPTLQADSLPAEPQGKPKIGSYL